VSAVVWAGVACLGAVGALLRFFVDAIISGRVGRGLPFGTLIVNVSGAFVFGLLIGLGLTGTRLLLAGTATLGSYTTFSTWMFETQRLSEEGEFIGAAGNILISVAVGLGAAALGRLLGGHL
jgi:CrcB protein